MTSPGGNSDHQSNIETPGDYVFADLAHLERSIGRWRAVLDEIRTNRLNLHQAVRSNLAPAGDDPSTRQANTYTESLERAIQHNLALDAYADGYVDRLIASRARYLATERDNADALRRAGS